MSGRDTWARVLQWGRRVFGWTREAESQESGASDGVVTHDGLRGRPMKLVVGLGNPGRKYQETRHNVGFDVLKKLAEAHGASSVSRKFQGELTDYGNGDHRVLLLCPTTYMNRSGQSVGEAVDFYKLTPDDLIVVCDDFNLDLGRLRFRAKGSAGGQKGLADIIRRLGTDEFARLRVGVGAPPPNWDPADYVLGKFGKDERSTIDDAVQRAVWGIEDWVAHDVQYCMNRYNGG